MAAISTKSVVSTCRHRALIIGNANYRNGRTLRLCLENVRDINEKLIKIRFETTLVMDLNCDQMDSVIEEFTRNISPGDLVLFFFSGYGIHVENKNFLLPIDDNKITSPSVLTYQAINIQDLCQAIVDRSPSSAVLILDACRSYRMSFIPGSLSLEEYGGFCEIHPPPGVFIILPCQPNHVLPDTTKNSRNTSFVARLLQHIDQANVHLNHLIDIITKEITYDNTDEPPPYRVSSILKNIYLNYQIQNGAKHRLSPHIEERINQTPMRSMIDLRQEQLTDRDMDLIVQQVIVNKQCTRLWLSGNRIGPAGAATLAAALLNNHHIERLHLLGNLLGEKGIKFLMKAIANDNRTLKMLNLQDTGITDISIECIAEMLKTNKGLISLWLGKNDITDNGLSVLSEVLLHHNNTLQYLDLSSNKRITNESIPQLEHLIKNARSLNELSIFDCHISLPAKEALAKIARARPRFNLYVKSWNE